MAYNKIEANGETLIDLTSDTVTADTLLSGRTAHLASGERVTGTFEPVTGVKGNAESTYRKGDVNLTPANLGLGNVNNTSDLNKPISTATQAALDAQQAQIDKALEQTGYNLVKITATTQTVNGITFTVDEKAGTITANGTHTGTAAPYVYEYIDLAAGRYVYTNSGNVEKRDSTCDSFIQLNGITIARGNDNDAPGNTFTLNSDSTIRITFRTSVGYNPDNFLFKPMIVPAELAGIQFQPYAKSNAELTQDLDDISEELDCLTIQAALVNNEVVIQNTSDFTRELYSKYFSYTKPKFAILKLQITSNTYCYKALLNSSSVSQATVMEASFITVNGTYMSIYKFSWNLSGTVGTPTVSHTSLNLGS